jgi:hypothetical protein
MLAKVIVCALFGVAFWAIATVLDGVATPFFLAAEHLPRRRSAHRSWCGQR